MIFKKITIQNFRKLQNIEFECAKSITTIVGPNGVGKSSILDAIRILKATLLPSSREEMNGSLQSLGVFSPHIQSVLVDTISGDLSKPTVIQITIEISQNELNELKENIDDFNNLRLQNILGQPGSNNLNLIHFLSTSLGKQQLDLVQKDSLRQLEEFEKNKIAQIRLTIHRNSINGSNGFHQELIAHLFKSPIFSETLFTVFTADRNFPTGDVNIQLGQNEITQQSQSYSIQPQQKFARLKAAIISYMLINSNDLTGIKNDFKLIFDYLLPGKELFGVKLEEKTGRLSVLIKEIENGKIYDIDFLSSGEKGLLLTLFLLLRTVKNNGIILLDEPELHLNPTVSKNLISFLKTYICEKKNAQIILTTHSAEILTDTKESANCQLLHLINGSTISPIYKKDNEEAHEAIKSLGIDTSDILFNKGIIYLEGTTDEDYLYELLKGTVDGFKIQSLGGRNIIENEVLSLQEADKNGKLKGYHVFIIDHDNKPTKLTDTKNVKIIQWDRYSLENYLLNLTIMYDVIKEISTKDFPSSRSEFNKQIKELAFSQIEELAVSEAITKKAPTSINLQKREIKSLSIDLIINILSERVSKLYDQLKTFDKNIFGKELLAEFEACKDQIQQDWEENWKNKCKGKELLTAVYNKYGLSYSKSFLKELIKNIKVEDSEEWKILKNKLSPIINKL